MLTIIAVTAALVAATLDATPDQAAFEDLKAMTGEWRQIDRPRPLTIRYHTISGGSAVVETWVTHSGHETMNVFTMDGGRLIATHYCAMGNQPTLELASTEGELRFTFRSATNLPSIAHAHQHEFTLRRDGDQLVRTETYREDGADQVSRLDLTRIP